MRCIKYLVVLTFIGSLIIAYPLSRKPIALQYTSNVVHYVSPVTKKAAVKQQALIPSDSGELKPPSCSQYAQAVAKYNWDTHIAMAIMQAESGCHAVTGDNSALNYDHVPDYGLFQLHGIKILDANQNIDYAYNHKYLTQGWRAWVTYNTGAYQKYL